MLIEKTLPSCIYPIKYSNEPLFSYGRILDNTTLLIFYFINPNCFFNFLK